MSFQGRFQRFVVLLAAGLALGTGLAGCATTSPNVKVLGFTDGTSHSHSLDSDSLVVFVEVVNPTQRELVLSRLEYQLDATSWFQTDGVVSLSRIVAPGSSTVIEMPVRIHRQDAHEQADPDSSVPYSLRGRLWAMSEQVQRSWNVNAEGVLDADAVADAHSAVVHVRVAGGDEY